MTVHKKNDVIEVNIEGSIVIGIILSDLYPAITRLIKGEKYLFPVKQGYEISVVFQSTFHLGACYYTLIGDDKVYVETCEIFNF